MKDFREIKNKAVQQNFRRGKVFQEGDVIMSSLTGEKGKIHRTGVNYVIAITESGEMFRAWVKDIRYLNVQETINKERKSSIFKNGKTETND
ncbi:possible cytitidyltransferase [Synechococcus phage S-PM2]|uniref:Possible cytitidyltransferase n=1 Tax=Synechococcus phage S-PM2 TaxID=238854 RepID=Q5GQJ6_BPSYP|nr:ribonucleotide reductase alpha subunit [Synechococcus phage S-PM2]CAF34206.1 ribonucleotide reductase A subunit [Synechococcus phage S-PM2]CFW42327.1 possible cytitidyltransferase [Synechococcus phage S-PM2]